MGTHRARIAIVGLGAIGGAVAADLADLDRHQLRLCVRSAIDRLEVQHPGGLSTLRGPFLTEPASAGHVDWIVLATKAHQSPAAETWLRAFCGPNTVVAVLQNGADHVERITELVPQATEILPVVVQLPSEKLSPTRVAQARTGSLVCPNTGSGLRFAALFEGARTSVRAVDDFASQVWWKLLANAALGGVCALALRENGVAKEPEVRKLVLGLMREVAEVGRAEGAQLPQDAPEKALDLMLTAVADHWTSIAVDRREGRPMEWRARNEIVGRLGRRHGIATPLNDAITALLRASDPPPSRRED